MTRPVHLPDLPRPTVREDAPGSQAQTARNQSVTNAARRVRFTPTSRGFQEPLPRRDITSPRRPNS